MMARWGGCRRLPAISFSYSWQMGGPGLQRLRPPDVGRLRCQPAAPSGVRGGRRDTAVAVDRDVIGECRPPTCLLIDEDNIELPHRDSGRTWAGLVRGEAPAIRFCRNDTERKRPL